MKILDSKIKINNRYRWAQGMSSGIEYWYCYDGAILVGCVMGCVLYDVDPKRLALCKAMYHRYWENARKRLGYGVRLEDLKNEVIMIYENTRIKN